MVSLFLRLSAVVLAVLALVAAAAGTALGVSWPVWVCGALVAFFGDHLLGEIAP